MEIFIYDVTDLSGQITIRKYDGVEIKSEFPVFVVHDKSGKELGFLIWSNKEIEPPFEKIIAYG